MHTVADIKIDPLTLATQGITLSTGQTHRIRIAFPQSPTLILRSSVFAFDSAFPAPGIFGHLQQIHDEASARAGARMVLFGHTDATGSIDYNKKLSDRRAKAVLALLKRDVTLFDAVASAESWGNAQYQAMLRGLGCNPGPIDGKLGTLTAAAVTGFQQEYNEGVYHGDPDGPPRAHGDLAVDGVLGPATQAALRDAYVAQAPTPATGETFNDPAFAGCSEFNLLLGEADEEDRRVVVAFIQAPLPRPQDFPCVEGDASACPVDDKPVRCKFYRRHFTELKRPLEAEPFFDFQWLREQSGMVNLSALTPLPDDTPARFTAFRWEQPMPDDMPSSATSSGSPPMPGEQIGEAVDGVIRGGVAFARWQSPEDFDPFSFSDWLLDHDLDLEVLDGEAPAGGPVSPDTITGLAAAHPPVFLIEAADEWAFSRPPSQPLDRIRLLDENTGDGVALAFDVGLVPWNAQSGPVTPANAAPADVGVVAMAMRTRELEPESAPDGDSAAA